MQSFPTFLKERVNRDESDNRYYPFVLEFEKGFDIEEAYNQAKYFTFYMNADYDVDLNDMVIIINNRRSVYVWVNPKVFGLKPGNNVHNIYFEMYKKLKKEFDLQYVDESVVSSAYRLIKTPGSYYNNGYVNYITYKELNDLTTGKVTKEELTAEQRDIRKLNLPSIQSLKLTNLYNESKSLVEGKKKEKTLTLPGEEKKERTCVKALLDLKTVEKGHRNNLLVTIAIGLRDLGIEEEEIMNILETKAFEWGHDESARAVRNKVKGIINRNTNFSCMKAKIALESIAMEHNCNKCSVNKENGIWIARNIITQLYSNNAAVRHYNLYLKLERYKLIGKEFTLEEVKTNERTLKELAKKLNVKLERKEEKFILNAKRSKAKYKLPDTFLDTTMLELGEHIKQYLMLVVKAFNGTNEGVHIAMNEDTIISYLGYKNKQGIRAFNNEMEKNWLDNKE